MPGLPGTRDDVASLMDGYLRTQLLYVAARLRLADSLANGPRSAADLAAAAGAEPSALHRVLRGLAILGIVDEVEGDFCLADAGRPLQSDAPGSLRGAVLSRGDLYYHAASGLLKAMQSGGSAFRHVYGTDFFDHLAASPEKLAAFQQSMVARSEVEVSELLRAYDFSHYHHVVDVGGGFGVTLSALLAAYPNLGGTLFDRPEVVPAAEARVAGAGLASRCGVVAGDALDAVPSGGDLYLLSRVIHDWTDDDAVRILRSCRTAMSSSSTLVLLEAVIADRASDHPAAVVMDLHMLVLGLGKERTRDEFRELLARAGLTLKRVIPTEGRTRISILEAACAS
jgi:hypothetical protein